MEGLQNVWGWQPALYLFLGGLGAGAFIAAMVAYFKNGQKKSSTVFASVCAAAVCLVVGLLLLLSELITPARGLMMWQSFSNFSSWMTIGAWVVFAAVIVFVLEALCLWDRAVAFVSKGNSSFGEAVPAMARVLGIVGCVLAFCVAAYTGILLMSAPGVPLWNTILLPCLFTVSALDTGIALVEVIAFVNRKKEGMGEATVLLLNRGVVALVVVELVVLAALLISMAMAPAGESHTAAVAAQSAALIFQGELAPWFWILVVALGLAVPLVASFVTLRASGEKPHIVGLAGAMGALIGGCALRFIIMLAGLHADPVIDTIVQLMG